MARSRNPENRPLPKRWRLFHGAYRYQVPPGQEHLWDGKKQFTLGHTAAEAYKEWAERLGRSATDAKKINDGLDAYALSEIPKLAPATQENYTRYLPRIKARFGHFCIDELEPRHVYEYHDKRVNEKTGEPAPTVAKRELEMLSAAYTWFVSKGWINHHPTKGEVRLKGEKAGTRYVDDWEVAEALALKPMRKKGSVSMCQAYIRLKLANTGLRQTDLLQLRTTDADEVGFRVRVSKTRNSTGRVQLFKWTPERRAAWDAALEARPIDIGPYLFCNADGECYLQPNGRVPGFSSIWQRFMDRVLAETKVTERFKERDLRAKVGSDQESDERAAKILGHTDTKVTRRHYRRKGEVIE